MARTPIVPPNRISQIVAGKRAVSADTALRLARYFGTSADLWMNLQKNYELDLARQQLGKIIRHIPRGQSRWPRQWQATATENSSDPYKKSPWFYW